MLGPIGSVLTLPLTVVQGIETLVSRVASLLDQVDPMSGRVGSLLDELEPMARRVATVLDDVEPLSGRVTVVLDAAEAVPDRIDLLIENTARLSDRVDQLTAEIERVLVPVLASVEGLDLRPVPALLEDLGQLGPVVSELGTRVVHLDQTVADVGAMLSGIPGAARLVKRGERVPR